MDTKSLIAAASILAIATSLFIFPDGAVASVLGLLFVTLAILLIQRLKDVDSDEKTFLVQVFLLGLIPRCLLASVIYGFNLQIYFGPDSLGYDRLALALTQSWLNGFGSSALLETAQGTNLGAESNWGLPYIIAPIYTIVGQNALAAQFLSSVCGAATSVIIYLLAKAIFRNVRVAIYSAYFIALFPAMIIWSCQLLKDGFIVFFLALSMLLILRLQKSFNYTEISFLILAIIGIWILRFYLFPLLLVAAIGGFIIGTQTSMRSLVGRVAALFIIGMVFMYFGVIRSAQSQLERGADLQNLQNVKSYGASTEASGADSGYGGGTDISTINGALAYLPFGAAYLIAAPFPWQMLKIQQILLLPEMVIWWISIPFTFFGIRYILLNRLRENISILIFIALLGVSYSLYQGNLGTMYRQRTQLQVLLFMFTSVGIVLQIEKREISKRRR